VPFDSADVAAAPRVHVRAGASKRDLLLAASSALLPFVAPRAAVGWILLSRREKATTGGRVRRWVAVELLVAAGLMAYLALGLFAGSDEIAWRYDRPRFERIVEQGEPIVAAIRRFETGEGRPPRSCDELVPAYAAEIPPADPERGSRFELGELENGGWFLRAPFGLDQSVYSSPASLRQELDGHPSRRFGDWVWVKET
jgi:hypothetical protein